ncbi:hypothetical protein B0H14DRAFT_3638113 [Mycena olivaceomarginata]|nr:hypothetical protein B0H14DRAFT_3638113 [Mycena olivaceomarginata]
MVHQWHYRRLLRLHLPPAAASPGSAAQYQQPLPIYSVPSRCFNVAPSALVAAIATAQPRPTSRRHPGSPFTAALAARPSLGSPECAAKREEDPYLVNIASTRRLATLPRLITLPRARRQDVKDRQGCYLLAALATFGIAFASAIADLRRPSATRPPPLTKLQITGRIPRCLPPPTRSPSQALSTQDTAHKKRHWRRTTPCPSAPSPSAALILRKLPSPRPAAAAAAKMSEAQSFPLTPPPPAPPPRMSAPSPPRASLGDTPPPPSPSSPNPMLNDRLCPIAAKKLSAPVPIQSQSLISSSPFDPSHSTLPTRTGRSPNASHEKKTKTKQQTACTHHPIRYPKNKSVRPALNSTIYSGHSGGTHAAGGPSQVREVSAPLSLSLSAALATPTPKICV